MLRTCFQQDPPTQPYNYAPQSVCLYVCVCVCVWVGVCGPCARARLHTGISQTLPPPPPPTPLAVRWPRREPSRRRLDRRRRRRRRGGPVKFLCVHGGGRGGGHRGGQSVGRRPDRQEDARTPEETRRRASPLDTSRAMTAMVIGVVT